MDKITDRESLAKALRDAANLEHQLMLVYLYAGFSLKRDPDDTCSPAQYERVRRWSSTLFMVARQEMEHLAFANGMLTAIGERPHFARRNIGSAGLQSAYLHSEALATGAAEETPQTVGAAGDASQAVGAAVDTPQPVSLPYMFERFNQSTIERFICGESPPYAALPAEAHPTWCFTCAGAPLLGAELGESEAPLEPAHFVDTDSGEVAAGTVQDLYLAIKDGFAHLGDEIFCKAPPFVEIPIEYNVYVFAIADRDSATSAIDLILTQGEGLGDPWNLDSHFRRFFEIRTELLELTAADRTFCPSYPLLPNPVREQVKSTFAGELFDVTNDAYATLLLILASLYQHAVPKHKRLTDALSQTAFAPAMTMIVRALNEILVRVPIDEGGYNRVASNYWLKQSDIALLEKPTGELAPLLERWRALTERIRLLAKAAKAAEAAKTATPPLPKGTAGNVHYVYESAHRIGLNLQEIYEQGLFAPFQKTPPK